MKNSKLIIDGNEAASYIAHKTNEVCAIYPITPASPMGEFVDLWSSQGRKNIWGNVPKVIELQSEGGASGTVHGALQGGALTTTFTASQGLLLMIPNMFKIAGELNPAVIHISARTIATHALSIFGDHSDVMATRSTGFAMLFSGNVQEVMDMAMIAHSATLKSRVPFLHIFDGFRTSHEISKIDLIPDETIREMIDEEAVLEFRKRCLNPKNPIIRGTAQNPDVFFQGRETINEYYTKTPGIVKETMEQFASLTGRKYQLFDYTGHPEAERIIVIMGSGTGPVAETVKYLNTQDEKVGFVNVRLFRPFSISDFISVVPSTVNKIAVLDRTKEPGAIGEPLYQEIISAFVEAADQRDRLPKITGGRYGLSSKEFTPAMVKGVFDELKKESPKNHFTIGIHDDITNTSLNYDPDFILDEDGFCGMFYGLGADGTVSANKNSIKIIGETTDNYVQGYFVYDSKKAGALTISHLRFGNKPIHSSYLVSCAGFIACHQFNFLQRYDVLNKAKQGAIFLLNSPYPPDEVWNNIPKKVQEQIIEKELEFYVIDATKVAREANLGTRLNTILQTCFFAISGILPQDEAIGKIKNAIEKTYSHKGESVVKMNFDAVDKAVSNLHKIDYPKEISSIIMQEDIVSDKAPAFVKNTLAKIMAGKGDELPVSAFPTDGTYPTATTQWEKRNIADIVPQWDEEVCTQCNKCVLICPHAAIRAKVYDKNLLKDAPETFKSYNPIGKDFDKEKEAYTLQVAVEDCTGCSICVEVCPGKSKTQEIHKGINMVTQLPLRETERENWNFFLQIPEIDRTRIKSTTVKGSQLLQPLFEFSGACGACGETPYLKLITQLFGDEMIITNATGCSSIYGGNLPTTPWCVNSQGRGPTWSNSLFEDNAEFGLGFRLAVNSKREKALGYLMKMKDEVGADLVESIYGACMSGNGESTEEGRHKIKQDVEELLKRIKSIDTPDAKQLALFADNLCEKSIWIIGGDGWAYDIGYGGLDHVLASGANVNILVLDTEVYSNTGGQTSKATPLGASAKFSISGKLTPKKELAMQAITYGSVYVAQVAMGAKDTQTVKAIHEANNYNGPSLIIAYSHCIEHGYDLRYGTAQQDKAVKSGYWPLYRYNPLNPKGQRFTLDSKEPSIPLTDYIYNEARYTRLIKEDKEHAAKLLALAEEAVLDKWDRIRALMQL
ncbi:MAG: pyruvate:ferredoxin (flavodoxin) oxidoreductase [Bacteroidota bacterium]